MNGRTSTAPFACSRAYVRSGSASVQVTFEFASADPAVHDGAVEVGGIAVVICAVDLVGDIFRVAVALPAVILLSAVPEGISRIISDVDTVDYDVAVVGIHGGGGHGRHGGGGQDGSREDRADEGKNGFFHDRLLSVIHPADNLSGNPVPASPPSLCGGFSRPYATIISAPSGKL